HRFADQAFRHTAKEECCDGAVTMGSDDHQIAAHVVDVVENPMEGASFRKMNGGGPHTVAELPEKFIKTLGGALAGLFLEKMDGGKLVRREPVGRVGRLRFEHMEEMQFGVHGAGELHGGCKHSGGCVREIDGGYDGFHGVAVLITGVWEMPASDGR